MNISAATAWKIWVPGYVWMCEEFEFVVKSLSLVCEEEFVVKSWSLAGEEEFVVIRVSTV